MAQSDSLTRTNQNSSESISPPIQRLASPPTRTEKNHSTTISSPTTPREHTFNRHSSHCHPSFLDHASPPKSTKLRSRLRTAIIGFCVFAAMSIATDWWAHAQFNTFRYQWIYKPSRVSNPRSSSWKAIAQNYKGLPACDPFAEPGSVAFNETYYNDASWVPLGSSCPPSPDYLSALRAISLIPANASVEDRIHAIQHPVHDGPRSEGQAGEGREAVDLWGRPYPSLDFLRGKTILWLGDSVDRNGLQHFHELLGANFRGFSYTDIDGPIPEGWDYRSIPYEVELGLLEPRNRKKTEGLKNVGAQFAGLNARLVNGFFYGLDDINDFAVQVDWHAPGLAEQRIEELFKPMMDQFELETKEPPAFISIQSGLWDLAFFGRQNRQANQTTESPLTAIQLDWWQNRMRSVIRTLKVTWPNTPIWIRNTHRVGFDVRASGDWKHGLKYGLGDPNFVNFFSDVRVHQIQQMQEQVARAEGIPIFDWGKIWEGYQKFQDKVHPLKIPGGVLMNQALMHHIWMESVGRGNWDPSLTNHLGPLPHPRP
ncbi:hypothetical protein CROQUDRAFT_681373 [Cronartium quercuum f. sp. fusiforme G11]|uniref:Uncharacterized protein n=1 Tax=Cronartium quercuum f. sp. fusiforme G11 TaxID=708437 RepID=A0A9P6NFA9_9BASI|nr:hypothetical protein CROQUDRAFT_681373 [Cronartium quercuum f. sp. fusiforme G11]